MAKHIDSYHRVPGTCHTVVFDLPQPGFFRLPPNSAGGFTANAGGTRSWRRDCRVGSSASQFGRGSVQSEADGARQKNATPFFLGRLERRTRQ
jgi:hypothetical protein